MTFVITRLCRDCVDGACVDACPVDCILEHRPADGSKSHLPNQLYIDPENCIFCGCCVPACPWEAIYDEDDVPVVFTEDIELNARINASPRDYHVPVQRLRGGATQREVDANKARWGLDSF